MEYYLQNENDVMQDLKTSTLGLSSLDASKRLIEHGKNELTKSKKKSFLIRFIEQMINPMILILLAAAAVSIIIASIDGNRFFDYAEAIIILAVVVLNSILGVVQESKAEKAIEALQRMTGATAKVRREKQVLLVQASDITIGDIVLLEAGDVVPADLRLVLSTNLRIEEAALTGESVAVDKQSQAITVSDDLDIPLGERKNMAYTGSVVVYGRGEGVVVAIGMATEIGKIAGIIQETVDGETPLQKRLSQLSKMLTVMVLGICVVVFAVRLLTTNTFNVKIILDSFMLAVSLAVAAIPEGLVAVVTIVLSIGVTNMAKRNAIVRRLTAVETLGCAEVICSDKTGTLTQNKMTVLESYGDDELLLKAMALCCDSQLANDSSIVGEPTENALVAFALSKGYDKNLLEEEFPRVAEAAFDSNRKMMSTIHKTPEGYVQYTKGAPDELLKICTGAIIKGESVTLTDEIIGDITDKMGEYTSKALRVLAVAYKELTVLPADCDPLSIEKDMTFIGLEAMIDPVRDEVVAAVNDCKTSGIRVVMITGDHKDTAVAIAKELGIITSTDQAITGQELARLTDAEYEDVIEKINVYARVQPEHKVKIVRMFKQKGSITAMTGDGVNDAPAIKISDIGIGMGITGTDVTKNVADMVLADDNFATIVSAVAEGRRIYDNIRKTLLFLLSTNFSEVIAVLVSTLMGFVLFKPVHLLFINLITDSLPAVALGMEKAEPDIMKRPPRDANESILAGQLAGNIIYQGIVIAILTLLAYFIVDTWDTHEVAMTSAFFTLSMCEIFQAFTLRSLKKSIFALKTQNMVLWLSLIASLILTMTIIYVPFLADIFALEPLTLPELVVSLGLSISIIPIIEIVKKIQRSRVSE